jgi:hypothetical protein
MHLLCDCELAFSFVNLTMQTFELLSQRQIQQAVTGTALQFFEVVGRQ